MYNRTFLGMIEPRFETMNVNRPYSHHVVEWTNDATGQRECRVCPRPVIGWAATLRHHDEAVRHRTPEPALADAIRDAVGIGTRALESILTGHVTDRDRARVIVEALEEVGAIQPRHCWKIGRHLHVA